MSKYKFETFNGSFCSTFQAPITFLKHSSNQRIFFTENISPKVGGGKKEQIVIQFAHNIKKIKCPKCQIFQHTSTLRQIKNKLSFKKEKKNLKEVKHCIS